MTPYPALKVKEPVEDNRLDKILEDVYIYYLTRRFRYDKQQKLRKNMAIFRLHFTHELAFKEIARLCNLSGRAVRNNIQTASLYVTERRSRD